MRQMKAKMFRGLLGVFLLCILSQSAPAQLATGGTYTLNRAVIASGGGQSTDTVNNLYTIKGTAGQPAAGYGLTNTQYGLVGGFWNLVNAPTAANASITGRVLREDGLGIRNVTVTLTGGTLTAPRIALSSDFGYFTFDNIESGQFYVISVTSRHYGFAQPDQTISVLGNMTDIVFQASWQN